MVVKTGKKTNKAKCSKLDVNAPPFYPSVQWYPVITDEYYEQRPHSPGREGFVIADAFYDEHEIPDEELFDPALHPLTQDELAELEQIDEINELLAELDIMETHQELHYKLVELTREKRASSDVDAEIISLMTKSTKTKDRVKSPRMPKKQMHCHMKKQNFVPLQQPRSVK
ncbi:hypothetical protein P43SY_007017 [Pythium insidiosum]|uniref:Uncharacterized protein n=1 Tax=Pythium insidiosum TaxID=114742 RepID=A0AAD5LQ07_PYTIN|nr:hypothetical protein P43SY_007017 [Pythium insidiosum]